MIRVNTKPRRKNAPRPAEKSAPGFLQWLRGRKCYAAVLGAEWECEGKIEAAHVYGGGDKGTGTKTADRHAMPLCAGHHRRQHAVGWKTFEEEHHFHAPTVAAQFWERWPLRWAWEKRNAG